MSETVYIVMPAYNEEENIEQTVREWHSVVEKIGADSRLVIFDDGSKDKTYEIMLRLKDEFSQFIPVTKPNSGHGSTLMTAYNYCIDQQADYVFQTDSDGQTSTDEFWPFWENRNQYDFVIGKRSNRQDGQSRVLVSRVLKLLVFLIFKEEVSDPNTPFRLMRTNRLRQIVACIPNDFFLSNVLISTLAVKGKEKVLWLPISFKPRQGGVNSINGKRIIKIGCKAIGDFRAIKKALSAQS